MREMLLPNDYIIIENEEMEYLDGGVYINNSTLKEICFAGGVTASTIGVAAIEGSMDVIAATIAATIPELGFVTGGLLMAYAGSFAVTACNALWENKGMNIRISFPWGLSFTVG